MPDKVFFDTHVLIYAMAEDDPRTQEAEELFAGGGVVSVQVLNEFVRVALAKMKMPWRDLRDALEVIQIFCRAPLPITLTTHQDALAIAEKYRFGIFDALLVASALAANCTILYTEDMHDGQVIDGRMRIRNPFR
ncbi:MAG TPA: PIN domain-containing protein [Candidatus Sulfotelmatobacter sp.]|jgi:predicted nucleic acid-binding protein|nr:PIN domain-containing protein [Candidatus Sulfotelmatobacter sp.]